MQIQDHDPHGPAIAVVVCGYTPARLDRLVAAATEARRQADRPGDEVVVVVDHHDDLRRSLAAALPAGIALVASDGPRGLSGARNSGVAATTAPVVVFLDDDALLRPGGLAAARARSARPGVAAVAGAVHPAWEGGSAPRWFPEEFGWVVGCDYRGLVGDGGVVRNPIGAAMAVRRDALALAGGFSSDLGRVGALPAGCEETLVGIRVRQELPGEVIVRDTGFAVDHHVPASRQRLRYLLSRCFHEGRSKAVVARAVGAGEGLSSERAYVARTLTTGAVRSVASAAGGDRWALVRTAVTVLGLAATVVGLLSARRTPVVPVTATAAPAAATAAPAATAATAAAAAPAGTGAGDPAGPGAVAADELVSVVVCTLGRDPRLVGTAAAVLAQSHPHLELLVVDNAPATGAVTALLAGAGLLEDPRLRIVPQAVRGLSAARNAGLEAATGALVAYTDDDAVPDTTWVEELVAVLRRDPLREVACVTGRVLAAEISTVEQAWFEESGVFDKGEETTVWSLRRPVAAGALGREGVKTSFFPYTAGEMGSGNNMVLRTAELRALGGFDEALGAGSLARGGEDLDIYRRVVLAGHVVVYTPHAVVRHFHRDSFEALREQMFGYGVGMAAVLTKLVLGGGRPALGVVRCLPRGVWTLLAPSSTKNAKKPAEMPRSLITTELTGYLAGPWLYVRSTAEARRRRAAAAAPAAPRPQPVG